MNELPSIKEQQFHELYRLKVLYRGCRLIFVSGNFNIVHPGHLRLLNFARSCGDILLVGLFNDSAPGVILAFEDRKATLLGLEAVTGVVGLSPHDLHHVIRILQPHTVVKGKEHEPFPNIEQEVVAEYGGHLIFSAGDRQFSSRDLLRREIQATGVLGLRADNTFLREHGLTFSSMAKRVDKFAGSQVIVIGDLIVDEYIYCDPLGMSQEDPTIVVAPIESKKFVGAAGIVAAHLAGLGAKVRYFSVVGNDETCNFAQDLLHTYGVETSFISDDSRPTSLKQRYRVQNKTLLRVSYLRSHDVGPEYWSVLLGNIKDALLSADIVVFSDFNYGCLPQSFVDAVISLCREQMVPFVADSQASSQLSDVGRFINADFLSATERETRLALNDFRSGLQNVANLLTEKAITRGLFVKLGPEGLILVSREKEPRTSSLMALNPNPVDVAGAGDAFLSAAALCRVSGGSLAEAAYIGSIAAAIQVGRLGNIPITRAEILGAIAAGSGVGE
jgi:rfaE bifunctional protein kinase chain/domain